MQYLRVILFLSFALCLNSCTNSIDREATKTNDLFEKKMRCATISAQEEELERVQDKEFSNNNMFRSTTLAHVCYSKKLVTCLAQFEVMILFRGKDSSAHDSFYVKDVLAKSVLASGNHSSKENESERAKYDGLRFSALSPYECAD